MKAEAEVKAEVEEAESEVKAETMKEVEVKAERLWVKAEVEEEMKAEAGGAEAESEVKVGGWSVGWSVGWWVGQSGGRSVQEGAFNELDGDDGVAEFMHGMLERKDHAIVEGDDCGVGLLAKTVQLHNLISAALQKY